MIFFKRKNGVSVSERELIRLEREVHRLERAASYLDTYNRISTGGYSTGMKDLPLTSIDSLWLRIATIAHVIETVVSERNAQEKP